MVLHTLYRVFAIEENRRGFLLVPSVDRAKGYYPRFPVGFDTIEEAEQAIRDKGARGEAYTIVPVYSVSTS